MTRSLSQIIVVLTEDCGHLTVPGLCHACGKELAADLVGLRKALLTQAQLRRDRATLDALIAEDAK